MVPGENVNLPAGQRNADHFFNVNAFSDPAPFTFGNAGRDILPGPGNAVVDVALHRRFVVTEGKTIEFRAETFNLAQSSEHRHPGPVSRLWTLLRQGIFRGRPTAHAICFKIRFLTLHRLTRSPLRQRCLAALRFRSPEFGPLRELSDKGLEESARLLRSHAVDSVSRLDLPRAFAGMGARPYRRQSGEQRRALGTYQADLPRGALAHSTPHGLEYLVLKGFTHCPRFVRDPRQRPQGDLDLLLPQADVARAFDAALAIGLRTHRGKVTFRSIICR